MLIPKIAMNNAGTNLQLPQNLPRKRKSTNAMREQPASQKQIKPNKLKHINPTVMGEQADGPKHIDPTAMDPDERDDEIDIADLMAKFKLGRKEKEKKGKKERGWVRNNITVVEPCTSCGQRISWESKCDDCRKCASCGQRTSREGKCEVCAKKRCKRWLDELLSEQDLSKE
jgi:hypothetical protein